METQRRAEHRPTRAGELPDIKARIDRLNERLARYIPPRETWSPAEEALYTPTDLFRVPTDDARVMQLDAIKYAFRRHFTLNHFYRKFCDMRDVTPDDVKTYDDLEKIPLVPDLTFKQHPSGVGFAHWIANIYTGELPTVILESAHPSFDGVINAFNAAGMLVAYSSGTSGQHTVIPRDVRTYRTGQFASAKLKTALYDEMSVDHSLLLYPKPTQTNLWIGKVMALHPKMYNDLHYALDFEISADLTLKAMTNKEQQTNVPPSAEERMRKTIEIAIRWLERCDKTSDSIRLEGPPFLIFNLMNTLEQNEKHFEFGERGLVRTGGGWKISESQRIPHADFRRRVEEVLGIPETRCSDVYSMIEINGIMITCPEGHYFHVPYTWVKPLVLDKSFTPAGYDESGRFAFLDGLAGSYPGFIITGDEVRMYEHCPVCDRPGPVLDPEVKRAPSVEMRGCAEEVRRVLAQDVEGRK
ncbi:MAG: LuxE/PaaK family acyltransferase [Halobacteriota archaeon]